jgi:hypothetical protein
MKSLRIFAIVAVSLFAIAVGWSQQKHETRTPPPVVSLIRIIANPEKFDGQRVRVIGYMGSAAGFDNVVGVCVSEDDGRNGVLSNCIPISGQIANAQSLRGKYVVFNAKYIASNWGLQNGELTEVSELKPLR